MKRYYITGVCGTGKSTIAEELNKRGIFAVDLDLLCSWKNNETKEPTEKQIGGDFLEANDWYCDIPKLKDILNKDTAVAFVVGVAANQDEFLDMFDKIFLLQCSPETFIKRIDSRTNNDFGKHPIEKEHVLNWYTELEANMLAKGAISINTEAPVGEVVDAILSKI